MCVLQWHHNVNQCISMYNSSIYMYIDGMCIYFNVFLQVLII